MFPGTHGSQTSCAPTTANGRDAAGFLSSPSKRNTVFCLLLILITVVVYNPVAKNSFINLDDNGYVTDNTHVHEGLSWKNVRWSLTTFACENWHPLTWVSHELDWQLFGKNAAGHHYMSALLHALNAVLLFLVLQNATGFAWRSLVVAGLYAVHPVNVESVAWAAERKNVLSMTFFLLALLAYNWYAKHPSFRRYSWMALLYAFALMAKPQVITFPFVVLLWDYWPLRRFGSQTTTDGPSPFAATPLRKLVLEKVPLLALSAGDARLTMLAQKKAVKYALSYSFPVRISNALVSYSRYVAHAFWPFRLSPAYSHPSSIPVWQSVAAFVFLMLITAICIAAKKRYLLMGWFWFLGILVPMIGLVQVGDQAMADRYAYIPYIGLLWMAVWVIAELAQSFEISSRWLAVSACLAVAVAALTTSRQVTYWRNGETLWRYALRIQDDNFMAHSYLAAVLTQENRHEEAMSEYAAAEKLHAYPLEEVVYFADYELRHNHVPGAVADAQKVLAGTNNPEARELAFRDLGIANNNLGKLDEAKQNYMQALQIDPKDPYVLMGMGLVAYRTADYPMAADFFSRTVAVDPSDFDYLILSSALRQSGRADEADAAYAHAQQVSKNWTTALQKANWFLKN